MPPEPTTPAFITEEEFIAFFFSWFSVPGALFKLQSLPITEVEAAHATEAAKALYDVATDPKNPWLHFIARPGSKWTKLAVIFVPLVMTKHEALQIELQSRQAAARKGNTSTNAQASQTVERDQEPPGGQIVG